MNEDHIVSWVTDSKENGTHDSVPVYCSEYTRALEDALRYADRQLYEDVLRTYGKEKGTR